MMRCEDIRELLSEYIDDVLDARQRRIIEDHLSQCPDCKAALDKLTSLSAAIKGLPKAVPPADFADKLNERIKTRQGLDAFLKGLFSNPGVRIPVTIMATLIIVITIAKTTDMYYTNRIHEEAAPRNVEFKKALRAPVRKLSEKSYMKDEAVTYAARAAAAPTLADRSELVEKAAGVAIPEVKEEVVIGNRLTAPQAARETSTGEEYLKAAAPAVSLAARPADNIIKVKTRLPIYKAVTKIALFLSGKDCKIAGLAKDDKSACFTVTLPSAKYAEVNGGLKALKAGSVDSSVQPESGAVPAETQLTIRLEIEKI